MKGLAFLFCFCFTLLAQADDLVVELNPRKPVAGEVFQAYFRIFTEASEEPSVNFSPSGIEVVGKSNQGVSTRTTYANGRLTVSREITVVYDLVAARHGTAWLRDISVTVGTKSFRHPSVSINVLREPEVAADVFLKADVPKTRLYVGEGVTVRYYLYSKVPVQNLDVKKYPKLNNFLKRFLQEPERTERVSVDGQIYLRSQIYAAKLFPEKVGSLKVDSLSLSATYPVARTGDPFGAFGMSRELKTRTLNSESVTLEVLALPTPVPAHYTGLVGKHDFSLDFSKSRLIVNEPLEAKLSVTGPGALENFEAPSLLKNPEIEEFESTSELKIADANLASKIFDYTFLPKGNLKLPPSQLTLSYLDPDSGRYVSASLPLPELEIAGGSQKSLTTDNRPEEVPQAKDETPKSLPKPPSLLGPELQELSRFWPSLPYVNITLALLSLGIALSLFIRKGILPKVERGAPIPRTFKSDHFDVGEFARWLSPLISKTGKTPMALIRDSDLDADTKTYFLRVLETSERGLFSEKKIGDKYEFERRHFKKLSRWITQANETPQ